MADDTTEPVEEVAVKLTGDASEYNAMFRHAAETAKTTSREIINTFSDASGVVTQQAAIAAQTSTTTASTTAKAHKSLLTEMFSDAGNILIKTVGLIDSMAGSVAGFLTGLITGPIKGIIGLIASVPSQFMGIITELDRTDRVADKLSLTVLDLRAAMMWSGSPNIIPALAETQKHISGLDNGLLQSVNRFKNLAAVSGETVESIRKGGWSGVYDAISRIEDPTKRAAQAFMMLGEHAPEFLDDLARGGAGRAHQGAKNMGLGVNESEMQDIRQVQQTMREMNGLVTGFMNQIILAIAPVISEFSKMFDVTKVELGWVKTTILEIVHYAGMVGVFLAESFRGNQKVWRAGITFMTETIDYVGAYLQKILTDAFMAVAKAAGQALWEAVRPALEAADFVAGGKMMKKREEAEAEKASEGIREDWRRTVVQLATEVKDKQASGDAVGADASTKKLSAAWKFGMNQKAFAYMGGANTDKIPDFINAGRMGSVLDIFRESYGEKDVNKWTGGGSPVNGAFKNLTSALGETDIMQSFNKITDNVKARAKEIGQSVQDGLDKVEMSRLSKEFAQMSQGILKPIDAWNRADINIKGFMEKGLGAGTDVLPLIAAKAFSDLQSGVGMPAIPQVAGAAEAGSREAISSIVANQMINDRGGIQDQIRVAIEMGNTQRQAQIDIGKQMLQFIRRSVNAPPAELFGPPAP